MRLSQIVRAAVDPFSELSPEGATALRQFSEHLAWWMGNTEPYSLKQLRAVWSKSPELKGWLKKHVNRSVPLYFGTKVKSPADLPAVGSKVKRKGNVAHWSKSPKVSRYFATGPTGGYMLEAKPPLGSVIVDVDAFSTLAGKHPATFKGMMTRKAPIEMFTGEQYESEVITTAVGAKVIEHVSP